MTTPSYNINVQTWIRKQEGKKLYHWPILVYDNITFGHVGDRTKEFVADSCRAAIALLLREPEVTEGDAYCISYRTIVKTVNGETVSDSDIKTIMNMSYESMLKFKEFALTELEMTNRVIEEESTNTPTTVKKRSISKMIFNEFFGTKNKEP